MSDGPESQSAQDISVIEIQASQPRHCVCVRHIMDEGSTNGISRLWSTGLVPKSKTPKRRTSYKSKHSVLLTSMTTNVMCEGPSDLNESDNRADQSALTAPVLTEPWFIMTSVNRRSVNGL
ncbi:hypothetical protein JOB18_001987 [Solea senegalensis]|uniref:Uncharacterized protein n=1 Tax=Solea senegalensis TaxID=28829 RepID=A0AAV6Q4Z1_SOLSE|nr:hypothetical protein JOB18_001987 [Solea senegalensis]